MKWGLGAMGGDFDGNRSEFSRDQSRPFRGFEYYPGTVLIDHYS